MLMTRTESEVWAIVDGNLGLMYCGDYCNPKPMVYATESKANGVLNYFLNNYKNDMKGRNARVVRIYG